MTNGSATPFKQLCFFGVSLPFLYTLRPLHDLASRPSHYYTTTMNPILLSLLAVSLAFLILGVLYSLHCSSHHPASLCFSVSGSICYVMLSFPFVRPETHRRGVRIPRGRGHPARRPMSPMAALHALNFPIAQPTEAFFAELLPQIGRTYDSTRRANDIEAGMYVAEMFIGIGHINAPVLLTHPIPLHHTP
ncbi:hypothetical protein C8R44DRAFT_181003 [Mycena epipterygia]|nr:hypothetical protein C8R44DRAFT_181003 [Mycena epipterygia]